MSHLEYLLWLDGKSPSSVSPEGIILVVYSLALILGSFFAFAGHRRGWSKYAVFMCVVVALSSLIVLWQASKLGL